MRSRINEANHTEWINNEPYTVKINHVAGWKALNGHLFGDSFELVITQKEKLFHHSEGHQSHDEAIADLRLWRKLMSEGKLKRFPTY